MRAEPAAFTGTVGSGGGKGSVRGKKKAPAVSEAPDRSPPQADSGPFTDSLALRETTPPTEGEREMTGKNPCPKAPPTGGIPFGDGERTTADAAAAGEAPPEEIGIDDADRLSIAAPEKVTTDVAKGKGGTAAPEEGFGSREKMSSDREAVPPLRCNVAPAGGVGLTGGWAVAGGSGQSWTASIFNDVKTPSRCCFRKGGRTLGSAPTAEGSVEILFAMLLPNSVPPEACRCTALPIALGSPATGVLPPPAMGILGADNGLPSPASFSAGAPAKAECRWTSRAPRVPCKRAVMAQVPAAVGGDKD